MINLYFEINTNNFDDINENYGNNNYDNKKRYNNYYNINNIFNNINNNINNYISNNNKNIIDYNNNIYNNNNNIPSLNNFKKIKHKKIPYLKTK